MTGHGSKFDRKKDEAIAALLSHKSIEDAARAIGINPNTLSRWKKEAEFLAALEEARRLVYTQAVERLRDAAGIAASTVLKVMIDPTAPAASRLKAAEIVLDKAEVTEDFELRLGIVEAFLQSLQKSTTPSPGKKRPAPTPLLEPPAQQPQIPSSTPDTAGDDEGHRERMAS